MPGQSTAQYRQKPVARHTPEERSKYVRDLRRLHGSKMTRGRKVKVNVRGKNVDGIIMEDLKPTSTSLQIKYGGKVLRKDLATIYGVEGMSDVEEAKPPSQLLDLKTKRAGTPRKLKLELQVRPKTPVRNASQRKSKIVKSAGTPRKKVAEAKPPKKKYKTGTDPKFDAELKAMLKSK